MESVSDFADALNVVPRSSVMVGDVPVGQVESVTRVGWHARVKMRIRNDVKLPDNAEAMPSMIRLVAIGRLMKTSDRFMDAPRSISSIRRAHPGVVFP